jgi:hypothetical protein
VPSQDLIFFNQKHVLSHFLKKSTVKNIKYTKWLIWGLLSSQGYMSPQSYEAYWHKIHRMATLQLIWELSMSLNLLTLSLKLFMFSFMSLKKKSCLFIHHFCIFLVDEFIIDYCWLGKKSLTLLCLNMSLVLWSYIIIRSFESWVSYFVSLF